METVLELLSPKLRNRVLLNEGKLLASIELKGDPDLLSFIGLAQCYGVTKLDWLDPDSFDRKQRDLNEFSDAVITESSYVQKYAIDLFKQGFEEKASDIHIIDVGAYGVIRFRRMGLIKEHTQLRGDLARALISVIFGTMCQSASDGDYSPMKQQDARVADRKWLPGGVHSMRIHTVPLQCQQAANGTGSMMNIRLLYDQTNATGSLEDRTSTLGYDLEDTQRFRSLTRRTGLSIISGPTGHGKSTVLKHIMEGQTTSNPEKNYISLEDPVEYPIIGVQQILINSKFTEDMHSRGRAYVEAIAGAMRSDPDVVMIGEIRYPEASAAAIDAALTGHSVWATLHANNAFGIIKRMVSLLNAAHYAEPLEYLCDYNVIAGLVYQRLLPVLCPECKINMIERIRKGTQNIISEDIQHRISGLLADQSSIYLHNKAGCEHCNHLGLVSQTVAAEVIVTDQAILEHLRKGEYLKAQEYWTQECGGRSYVQHAIELIGKGLIDPQLAEVRLGVPLNFHKTAQAA